MRLPRRNGYSVMELLIVLVILIILGSVIVPTIAGAYGNSHQKAAADLIRSRITEARAKAIEQGVWYRVAINRDKTRIRVGPDGPNFTSLAASPGDSFSAQVTEDTLEKVEAEVVAGPSPQLAGGGGSSGGGGGSSGGGSSGGEQLVDGNVLSNGAVAEDGEWITVVTVGPEGICKETLTTINIKERKFDPVIIQVQGIAGSSAIVKAPPSKNGGQK